MGINSILFILFMSVCALTFAVIKLYSELKYLHENHIKQEEYNIKLFRIINERFSDLERSEK